MQYYQFPGTDLSVSSLCFGCWGVISDAHWGDRHTEDSVAAILAAVDQGVNFFDTAPMYGDGASESLLGKVVADNSLRDQLVIATKIRPNRMKPDEIVQECEDSLRRLNTEFLDLYQTHWTDRSVPLEDSWETMLKLQQQGKVRHVGVCNAGVQDMQLIGSSAEPLTNQLPYNLLWRMIEYAIQPECVSRNVGILTYSPLLHGMLSGQYHSASEVPDGRARTRHFSSQRAQTRHNEPGCEDATFEALNQLRNLSAEIGRPMSSIALRWLLQRQGVVSVIAGARNADQLRQNVDEIAHSLSDNEMAAVDQITDSLKQQLGENPDMWDSGNNARIV